MHPEMQLPGMFPGVFLMKGENHMAQNQYKCEACGASFNSEAELEQHNRAMHSQYKCEACGQTFNSQSELEAHTRTAHPEQQGTPGS